MTGKKDDVDEFIAKNKIKKKREEDIIKQMVSTKLYTINSRFGTLCLDH